MEIQLPCQVVEIPDVPLVCMPAINALIHFNRGDYLLPANPTTLVSQLKTADFLGADIFLGFIGRLLCVSPKRLNLSNDERSLQKVVHDRYRLAMRVQLKYPLADVCYLQVYS